MSKKKKKNPTMVNMSARLNIKIASTIDDETDELNKDLAEIQITVERRMQSYEAEIKAMYISLLSESVITTPTRDSSYFIEKYQDMIDRNAQNIINRMRRIQGYLQEVESEKDK